MQAIAVNKGIATIGDVRIAVDKLEGIVESNLDNKPLHLIVLETEMAKNGQRPSYHKVLAVFPRLDDKGLNVSKEVFVWNGSLEKNASAEDITHEGKATKLWSPIKDSKAELVQIGNGVASAKRGTIVILNFQEPQTGGISVA
jgi:hypothetical protein